MSAELDRDIATYGHPYQGEFLTERGNADYIGLLRSALMTGTEVDLIVALNQDDRVLCSPVDAARRLASTEFNRYYMRAICLRAQAHGTNTVVAHRLRGSKEHRLSSDDLEGRRLSAPMVLENLRGRAGMDSETGLGRPNSGLSLRCGCERCISVSCGCTLCLDDRP